MKDYILNKIPVLTWRWLKMNETAISLPSENSSADIKLFSENATNVLSDEHVNNMKKIPTGMGETMTVLMEDSCENIFINTENDEKSCSHINIVRDNENLAKVRVYIYAKEGSEVNVWMDYSSNPENFGALGVQTFVYAEKNAKIKLYQVGLQDDNDVLLNDVGANIEKDASLELVQLLLGGKKVFAGARASLVGKRSEFISDLAYYGKSDDQIDLNYVADHIAK